MFDVVIRNTYDPDGIDDTSIMPSERSVTDMRCPATSTRSALRISSNGGMIRATSSATGYDEYHFMRTIVPVETADLLLRIQYVYVPLGPSAPLSSIPSHTIV